MERPPSSGRFPPRVQRALIPRDADPAAQAPADTREDVAPNPNPAVGTVGPNVGPGFGDTHVMYPAAYPPAQAERWDGWPLEWGTPWLEPTPTWSTFFGYGQTDPAGYATRVSTVGTCVDLNSRTMAGFAAYGVSKGVPVDLPQWYQWSPEPRVYADWCEFMKAAVTSYLLSGEAVLWSLTRYENGYPARFVVLNPARFTIDDDGAYWYERAGGDRLQLDPFDVLQIRYQLDQDTGRGIGPLAWAARNLVSADVLDRYALNIARHGTSAVLIAPGELSQSQTDKVRNDWAAKRAANPGTPAVLSGGLTYTPLSLSPRDMALLDLKLFDLQMIAAAFGTPAGLVSLPNAAGGLAYSSPDMLADQHWRQMLLPTCQAFAGALSNWLLPRGTRLEFNPDRYVQPGLATRAQAYATMHAIADPNGRRPITSDEVRVYERFAPWPGYPVADDQAAGAAAQPDSLVGSARG